MELTGNLIHTIENITIGTIIKRPSRHIKSPYVADILVNGEEKLAHCPSLGLCGMICQDSIVFISPSSAKSKTDYKVHAVQINEFESQSPDNPSGKVIVGCDPILSNTIGKKMFDKTDFFDIHKDKHTHKSEYSYKNSRFDHFYETPSQNIFVEIKSVPTCDFFAQVDDSKERKKIYKNRCFQSDNDISKIDYKRRAVFPDGYKKTKDASVSERANKHLTELTEISNTTIHRACLCLFVMRSDCTSFQTAWQVDPLYNKIFNNALDSGVEISIHKFEWIHNDQSNTLECKYLGTIPIIRHD
jgi:DNA-binding sugar fermentation-stimulating protein